MHESYLHTNRCHDAPKQTFANDSFWPENERGSALATRLRTEPITLGELLPGKHAFDAASCAKMSTALASLPGP
jgi:hypothetical protein